MTTLALRVHHLESMRSFYSQAFGVTFHKVQTADTESWFGELAGITIKLVPIREATDFEDYPVHQPGFLVPDVGRVIELATRLGGRQEGEILKAGGRTHGAIRDPDGNTIELYSEP